jgi:flagella basal body P-ring formation protein FlgA
MMFEPSKLKRKAWSALMGAAAVILAPVISMAQPTAVVPHQIIYPGEEISFDMVKLVDVINPNLRPGYAKVIAQVEGFVTKKTLLPGRIIPVSALREAYMMERGKNISMVFSTHGLMITAQGVALQNGTLGEIVRARNLDSGTIIIGTVMQDGTLRVMSQ